MRRLLLIPYAIPALLLAAPPSFETTVAPFIKKNCAMCHNSRNQQGGVNLLAFQSTAEVNAKRDVWELVARKIETGEMPPAPLPKPAPAAAKSITHWIEKHFETIDRNSPPNAGRVVARRLNRMEYNNTVRDLLGVNFQPAEDFPADDSGYGFDNIGAVLTISPVLMEKYLNAAEQIARTVINTEPLPQPVRVPFGAGRMKNRRANFLEIQHTFPAAGRYEVLAQVTGKKAGGPQWTMPIAFSLDRTPVGTQTATMGTDRPRNATLNIQVTTPGVHRVRVEFPADQIPNATEEVNDKTINQFEMLMDRLEVRGPYEPFRIIPDTQKRLLTCNTQDSACARSILSKLLRRAYRRPVTTPEIDRVLAIVNNARAAGDNFEQSIQAGLQAILVSPHFLFRIERGTGKLDPKGMESITDLEFASRLSYFLWSSMPDDALLAAAESNTLRKPTVLAAQVQRMLADPRADALADAFAAQWLEFRNLDLVKPDADRFPQWNANLKSAMQQETRLFFLDLVRNNANVMTLIDARHTYLNETLARHYGIPGVQGPDFRKVLLPDGRRGGILSMASVLTVSSYATRTSPVIRGKWVLENILNAPPPQPPPDVPQLDEAKIGTQMSLREQLKLHRSNATCSSCHARMDAIGFGLENYDAIGAWREMDGKFPLDTSGTMPSGESFAGPEQLKKILAANPRPFTNAFTEKLMTFALGRGLERYDRPAVAAIVKQSALRNNRAQDFILGIVQSLPFQKRRPEGDTL